MSFKKRSIRRVVAGISALMMMSAFIIMPASATEDAPTDHGQSYAVVQASTLNVRMTPSTDGEILATLPVASYVKVQHIEESIVDGVKQEWVMVTYDNEGHRGYVSKDYVNIQQGEIPDFDSMGGMAAVEVVKKYLGVPYVYGGTSPRGFDCSGLMQYVYAELGYKINRVADAQMQNGIAVAYEDLAPGDLVGFYSSPGSGYVSHIGMYVGEGMMIHAPHTGDVVRYASIVNNSYAKRFAGGRRIIY